MHSWKQDNHSVFCNRLLVTVIRAGSINLYLYRRWPGKTSSNRMVQSSAWLMMAIMTMMMSLAKYQVPTKILRVIDNNWHILLYLICHSIVWHSINAYSNILDDIRSDLLSDLLILSSCCRRSARSSGGRGVDFRRGQGDIKHHKTIIKP